MALTVEKIAKNTALAGLTEEQQKAIASMSVNDEAVSFNTMLDSKLATPLETLTGQKRNAGEDAIQFATRVTTKYKDSIGSSTEMQAKLDAANTKVADLEKQLADNSGDESIKTQLAKAQADYKTLNDKYLLEKKSWQDGNAKHTADLQATKLQFEISRLKDKLTFKPEYTEDVQNLLMSSAENSILGKYTPDWVKGADGKEVLVFRDANGSLVQNAANGLENHTVESLFVETLGSAVKVGHESTGAGTKNPGASGSESSFDLTGVKTQVEADRAISDYLMKQGLTADDPVFSEKHDKIRESSKVSSLPIR